MSSQRMRSTPRRTRGLPGLQRRSVRLRLTALYGTVFIASGVVLLAIVSGVTVVQSRTAAVPADNGYPSATGLGQADARIRQLQNQLAVLSRQSHSNVPHDLLIASIIALATMTLISIAFGWLIAGRALRPVREMTAAAQRISEDNLNERLAVAGPADELKELGDTIDGLLERLESAFKAQRRFVANASHELRTPLTTMRASLDVALGKPEPAPPQTIALAARLRGELDRMDTLLEALLVLARVQHRDLPGHAVLPLEYVVSAALESQTAALAERNLTLQTSAGPSGAWVTGSKALLTRMVENVIDNAVRHNQPGGWIRIAADTDGGLARLTVENGGALLDQRQVANLAQPFRRLGADRVGSDAGSGLGLSIVAAIVEAHDGRLELRARENGGLRVCIELPAATLTATVAAVPAGSTA